MCVYVHKKNVYNLKIKLKEKQNMLEVVDPISLPPSPTFDPIVAKTETPAEQYVFLATA